MAQTPLHQSELMERFITAPTAHALISEAAVHFLQVSNGLQRIARGDMHAPEVAEHCLRNFATGLELMGQAQRVTLGHIDTGIAELAASIAKLEGRK